MAIAEWRRAGASMRAAQLCHDNGLYADAISRAYYAVLHAARAALQFSDGLKTETHRATNNQFGQLIVLTQQVEPAWGNEIGALYDLRSDADYEVEEIFSEDDGRDACQRAAAFLERIMRLLATAIPTAELA